MRARLVSLLALLLLLAQPVAALASSAAPWGERGLRILPASASSASDVLIAKRMSAHAHAVLESLPFADGFQPNEVLEVAAEPGGSLSLTVLMPLVASSLPLQEPPFLVGHAWAAHRPDRAVPGRCGGGTVSPPSYVTMIFDCGVTDLLALESRYGQGRCRMDVVFCDGTLTLMWLTPHLRDVALCSGGGCGGTAMYADATALNPYYYTDAATGIAYYFWEFTAADRLALRPVLADTYPATLG